MKKLKPSSQYKKDVKRYRNNPKMIAELMTVLGYLKNEEVLRKLTNHTC